MVSQLVSDHQRKQRDKLNPQKTHRNLLKNVSGFTPDRSLRRTSIDEEDPVMAATNSDDRDESGATDRLPVLQDSFSSGLSLSLDIRPGEAPSQHVVLLMVKLQHDLACLNTKITLGTVVSDDEWSQLKLLSSELVGLLEY